MLNRVLSVFSQKKTIIDGDVSPIPLENNCLYGHIVFIIENTIIDWISHMGRIVKPVLPVTSAFGVQVRV